MSAPFHNQNAKKPAKELARSSIFIRCKVAEKSRWKKVAGPNLSQWAIETLNREATKTVKE